MTSEVLILWNLLRQKVILKSHFLHRDLRTVENSGNSFSFTHIPLPCWNMSLLFYFCSLHWKCLSIRIYVKVARGTVVKWFLHVDRESLGAAGTKMLPSRGKAVLHGGCVLCSHPHRSLKTILGWVQDTGSRDHPPSFPLPPFPPSFLLQCRLTWNIHKYFYQNSFQSINSNYLYVHAFFL